MAAPNSSDEALFAGRYRLLNKVGEGGFGVVYKALQLTTNQSVAIKVLRMEKAIASGHVNEDQRFQREMQVIGKLQHPNIVRLLDAGQTEDGKLFTVLEFIEGEELKDYVARQGGIALEETIHLMTQVLDALSCAHKHGIVHRDLKPQNVMVNRSGMRSNAMVLDFGIAGIVENARGDDYKALTAAGKIHGTPQYMAPEQIAKTALTPQTDLYAWGLIFLECLTGQQTAEGTNLMDLVSWQISPDPVELPDKLLGHPIADVLRGVLEKDINKRTPDATQVYEAIQAGNNSAAKLVGLGSAPKDASLHSQKTAAFLMPGSAPGALPVPPPPPPAPDSGNWKLIAFGAMGFVGFLLAVLLLVIVFMK